MSKTVTIPGYMKPDYVVIVNNKKYTYPAGATMEVPDEVAAVIDHDLALEPVPNPAPASGGGVQADLAQNDPSANNYVKNRTHYEGPLDIEWDGVVGDKHSLSLMPGVDFVKVSDCLPTLDELTSATVFMNGSKYEDAKILASDTDFVIIGAVDPYSNEPIPMVVVVRKPIDLEGSFVDMPGMYFIKMEDSTGTRYITKLHLDKFARKIPQKYLPDGVPWKEPVVDIEWDGSFDGRYYYYDTFDKIACVKVSDYLPTDAQLSNSVITVLRGETETEEKAILLTEITNKNVSAVSTAEQDVLVVVVRDPSDSIAVSAHLNEPGVYFESTQSGRISKLRIGGTVHKLPAEYAPEIPFFDLVEMGLPAVPVDVTDTGHVATLKGTEFTEFENALQRGAVRVRYAVDLSGGAGTSVRYMTSMAMPSYDYDTKTWQLAAVGVYSSDSAVQSLRVALMFFVDTATIVGHCALLQHFTM